MKSLERTEDPGQEPKETSCQFKCVNSKTLSAESCLERNYGEELRYVRWGNFAAALFTAEKMKMSEMSDLLSKKQPALI